jgi:hypothetical protein
VSFLAETVPIVLSDVVSCSIVASARDLVLSSVELSSFFATEEMLELISAGGGVEERDRDVQEAVETLKPLGEAAMVLAVKTDWDRCNCSTPHSWGTGDGDLLSHTGAHGSVGLSPLIETLDILRHGGGLGPEALSLLLPAAG